MNINSGSSQTVPMLKTLWLQAFGDSEAFADLFFREGFSPERSRCIYKGSRPVAALYWFDCLWQGQKVAYLYGIATDKAFQNQGLCRSLMEDTHRYLRQLGYAVTVLVPAAEGLFSLYQKLGYRSFCPMERRIYDAAQGQSVNLREISAKEYALLRRDRLPENALLQEGAALSFLSGFARFYRGENLLFCADRDGDKLHFQEFFGAPASVSSVICAMGASSGTLRLYGTGTDFAMYLPLAAETFLPGYFGIAMD